MRLLLPLAFGPRAESLMVAYNSRNAATVGTLLWDGLETAVILLRQARRVDTCQPRGHSRS